MRAAVALLALALLAISVSAEEAGRRRLAGEEAHAYRAVGRLNIAGRRFCTATLISERVIATAAHCLFNPRTGKRVALRLLRFVAGYDRGELTALREIEAAAVPAEFVFDEGRDLRGVQADVALLRLDAEIAPAVAPAIAPGPPPPTGAPVAIVSYARDRPHAPSISEGCRVPAVFAGVAAVDCAIDFGASGAPVLAGEGSALRLVAVVSAMGQGEFGGLTLAVPLAPRLRELEADLVAAEQGGQGSRGSARRP